MMMTIWYHSLIKPPITPPEWVFTTIWAVLYLFMAIAFVIVFRNFEFKDKKKALVLFIIQLLLNLSWTPAFFILNNIGLSLVICAFLLVFVIFTMIEFFKHSKVAGYLFIPYLLWVAFALWLTFQFLILN